MSDMDSADQDFFARYVRDEAEEADIDAWVERWHEGSDPQIAGAPLHAYLGLSDDEYQLWVYDPDILPVLREAHRTGTPLHALIRKRTAGMQAGVIPSDPTVVRGLQAWLSARHLRV